MLIVENILSHLRSAACYHGWALFIFFIDSYSRLCYNVVGI